MNTFIAYHSTDDEIDEFDFDKMEPGPGSSTRMDALFFSDTPQKSYGERTYKVKLTSQYPVHIDLRESRFDSLGIQEAIDALLRGETGHLAEDLVNHKRMSEQQADDITWEWYENADLFIIHNVSYARHGIEYIVPDPYYTGNSAKIENLGEVQNESRIMEFSEFILTSYSLRKS